MDHEHTPTLAELTADPEIALLLTFTPVPRILAKANGWSAEMQRLFIAWLAHYGSPTKACDELGKARSGIDKVYKSAGADEFRASWDGAIALAQRRRIARLTDRNAGAGALRAPTMSRARPAKAEEERDINGKAPLPGQMMNERGEWEDEGAFNRRAQVAKNSIAAKLLGCRRLLLQSIADCPGKRAAFEILTEYPIDWDKAAKLEPQDDEPYQVPNLRRVEWVVTAECGWLGEFGYGEDRKQAMQDEINRHRAKQGLPPVDWSESAEDSEQAR
ncbi:MAG: hypothetical protein V4444_00695 [Pseudomonadota bacterium]